MAIGTAKLLGFNLIRNFNYPYFSRDITEFWKRWHISLTTWFRDYVFLPLSFKYSGLLNKEKYLFIRTDQLIYIAASVITWLLTGLWHGSNYTFLAWGLLNGLYLILYHIQIKSRKKLFKKIGIQNNHPIVVTVETLFTFMAILVAWVFFRSENIGNAFSYLDRIFSASLLSIPDLASKKAIILAILFLITEWVQKKHEHALELGEIKWRVLRWSIYIAVTELILILGNANHRFIYFQF
jgi:D-alanyl-lipoteichoic acid acyltransferase DltB (MBOAT superfamily)